MVRPHNPPCCHWQEHAQRFFDEHPPQESRYFSLAQYVDDVQSTWDTEQTLGDPEAARIMQELRDELYAHDFGGRAA